MNSGQDAGVRPRRIGVLIAIAVTALALDVITKAIVVATLPDRPPISLLGGLLTLRVLRNSGAAFNIGNGMTIVFTVIATGVVVAILRYARKLRSLPWAITLGLLLGGALGNLADRLLRSPGVFRGHVVDWIELPHWPVFNLADASIVCGGVLAVLLASRGLQVDGTVQSDDPPEPPSGSATTAEPEPEPEPEPAPASAPSDDAPVSREDHSDGSRPDAKR
jgi:lipoprotein signal peptidase